MKRERMTHPFQQRLFRGGQIVPQTTNPAFLAAWLKGFNAGLDGVPLINSPYNNREPKRTKHGKLRWTFKTTFNALWLDGWQAANAVRTEARRDVTNIILERKGDKRGKRRSSKQSRK